MQNEREREIESKIFHGFIHSPSGRSGWSWANLKPGARSLLQVSHMGAGCQGFGPSSFAFPGHKQGGSWTGSVAAQTQTGVLMGSLHWKGED